MKVDLLFPPLFKANGPYFALPALAGFLRANGCDDVSAHDLNIDYIHYLMRDENLQKIGEQLERRALEDASAAPAADAAAIEQETVRHAARLTPVLRRWLPETLELLRAHRDADHVRALPRDRAVDETAQIEVLFDVLCDVYSAYYFPWRTENLVTRRQVVFSNDTWSGAETNNIPWRASFRALRHPRNPFLDYFATEVLPALEERRPAVVGVSLMFRAQFLAAFTLADLIRQRLPETHVCVGGALFSDVQHYLFSARRFREAVFALVDSVVVGPGETPCLRLLEHLDAGSSGDDIANVLTLANTAREAAAAASVGGPAAAEGGDGRADRVALPSGFDPAGRDALHGQRFGAPIYFDGRMDRYLYRTRQIAVPYMASRGCYWNRCAFCRYRDQAPSYEQAPLDRVLADLGHIVDTLGSRLVHFNDDSLSPSFCKGLSARLIADGLDLTWSGNTRFDPGFSRSLLDQMKRSGCEYISVGLESGSQRLLDRMGKGTRLSVVEEAMASCRAVGLPINLYLFFGFPGETRADLDATLAFLERHRGAFVDISVGPFSLYKDIAVFRDPERFGVRNIGYGDQVDPDVLTWTYEYELDPGGDALTPAEAASQFYVGYRAIFGEFGACASTDGSV